MPFSIKDVEKHTKKAMSDKLKRQWVGVANSSLEHCEGDAATCDTAAIRKANGAIAKEVGELAEFYGGEIRAYIGGATSFADILAIEKAKEITSTAITRTYQWTDLVLDILHNESINDKSVAIKAVSDEYLVLISEMLNSVEEGPTEPETPETETAEVDLCESAAGHFLAVTDGEIAENEQSQARAPLTVDFGLIYPGFGNKKDNHYYPREMLKRDARMLVGTKMYTTDHRQEEKSVRTEVGVIESIAGFTDDGAPIGRAVIFDPGFAEATRNRAIAGKLSTLECSILAKGRIRKGTINGRQTNIVEALTLGKAVDLVTSAGAGGQALAIRESNLQENDTGGEIMPDENENTEVTETEETEEADEQTLQETGDQSVEEMQETETDEGELLLPSSWRELLAKSGLSEDAQAILVARPYKDESQVEEAIAEMQGFIKRISGSGNVFGLGETTQPTTDQPLTLAQLEERKQERFQAIMAEVDPGYVANLVGG